MLGRAQSGHAGSQGAMSATGHKHLRCVYACFLAAGGAKGPSSSTHKTSLVLDLEEEIKCARAKHSCFSLVSFFIPLSLSLPPSLPLFLSAFLSLCLSRMPLLFSVSMLASGLTKKNLWATPDLTGWLCPAASARAKGVAAVVQHTASL